MKRKKERNFFQRFVDGIRKDNAETKKFKNMSLEQKTREFKRLRPKIKQLEQKSGMKLDFWESPALVRKRKSRRR